MASKRDPSDVDLSLVTSEELARELTSRFDVGALVLLKRMAAGRDSLVHVFKGMPLEVIGLLDFTLDMGRRKYGSDMRLNGERDYSDEDDDA